MRRAVAETLSQGVFSAEDDLATTDPAVLLQALQRLPADMRAEFASCAERSKP